MSIPISDMVSRLRPENTVLFFGAGSSIPSGAPSVDELTSTISKDFQIDPNNYSLSEIASFAEQKTSRKDLISTIRKSFNNLSPAGSILNLPLYNWKNIYTTNYDQLIEQSYELKRQKLNVYTSNFDFTIQDNPETVKLYKLHGTIDKDISDGHQSRLIVSESDYDNSIDYRETLYDSLKNDLNRANLVVIGYSLSDAHIKEIINRAIGINNQTQNPFSINLIMFARDDNRASLYERRGIKISFGGLDDFFLELGKAFEPEPVIYSFHGNPLDIAPTLNSLTIDISHSLSKNSKNASAMYQGWPATYADIEANITFERTLYQSIIYQINNGTQYITILGAGGTGKTTLARQVMLYFMNKHYCCWEHKNDFSLQTNMWRRVARELQANKKQGILFIDDAHYHLWDINNLIDLLASEGISELKLLFTSARNHWYPRIKSPNLFKLGQSYWLGKLDESEVENLLSLVDTSPDLQPLLENSFSGFSRIERKRRLVARCESDTFVCLKNIFASEKFDDIVLREYAELDENYQNIYRLLSAMETAGIKIHRQLVIRLLGIPAEDIQVCLRNLVDIIHEYTVSEREGIYGWKGRHPVISDIVTKYKMTEETEYYKLIENVIDSLVPTYDIEIRTIRQLCGFHEGIGRFPDKHRRNKLLRKLISKAPGERIPRHRLIRNLIELGEYEKAETEIRLFEKDFRIDGPVLRYRIILMLARAQSSPGILLEDRIAILEMAKDKAINAIEFYPNNKNMLRTYCDVGFEYFKLTGKLEHFDDAISKLREAEERIGDPEITNLLVRYERKMAGEEYEENDHG